MHNKIYELTLNQEYSPTNELKILRVPGGWVYTIIYRDPTSEYNAHAHSSSVFVPCDNEFKLERS